MEMEEMEETGRRHIYAPTSSESDSEDFRREDFGDQQRLRLEGKTGAPGPEYCRGFLAQLQCVDGTGEKRVPAVEPLRGEPASQKPRMREKKRPERAAAEVHQAARKRAAGEARKNAVSEDDRPVVAEQRDFAHPDESARRLSERVRFIACRQRQALGKQRHGKLSGGREPPCQRPAIGKPVFQQEAVGHAQYPSFSTP